jgi:NAD(P)-dependent dehydrogenase (short-subunit alcohol dehydrogenase family)
MNEPKKTALVTGANKGIGLETARQLAQQGFLVWLGSRDDARGTAAARTLGKDGDVRFVQIDVTSAESVRAAAARIEKESGALDVLVNNAGIIAEGDGLPSAVTIDALDRTLDVNLHGALRVTQAFLPLLKRSSAGRIVNVSSTMGSVATLSMPNTPLAPYLVGFPNFAYAASKTALGALTAWLAFELRDTAIKVNALCPGFNATDMNNHTGTLPPSEGAKLAVRAATFDAQGPTGTFFDANGPVGW